MSLKQSGNFVSRPGFRLNEPKIGKWLHQLFILLRC